MSFIKSKVYNIVSDYKIEYKVVNDVLDYFESLGYVTVDDDAFLIGFSIIKIYFKIKNICGINVIPDELNYAFVELSVAEILTSLKASGKLNQCFNLGDNVKTVNIGDTSVTFDLSNAEKSIQNLIDVLSEKGELEVLCYRKLRW